MIDAYCLQEKRLPKDTDGKDSATKKQHMIIIAAIYVAAIFLKVFVPMITEEKRSPRHMHMLRESLTARSQVTRTGRRMIFWSLDDEEIALIGEYVPEFGCMASFATFDEEGYLSVVVLGGHDGYEKELKRTLGKEYPYIETDRGVYINIEGYRREDGSRPHKEDFTVAARGEVEEELETVYTLYHGVTTEGVATIVGTLSFDVSIEGMIKAGHSGMPVVKMDG